MRIETYGQQIEVTEALREYVASKLSRLDRHFDHQPIGVHLRVLRPIDRTQQRLQYRADVDVGPGDRGSHGEVDDVGRGEVIASQPDLDLQPHPADCSAGDPARAIELRVRSDLLVTAPGAPIRAPQRSSPAPGTRSCGRDMPSPRRPWPATTR